MWYCWFMLAFRRWSPAVCGWARTEPEPNQIPLDRKGAVQESNYSFFPICATAYCMPHVAHPHAM